MDKKYYGNWFDENFPEDIEENFEDLDDVELTQDSDGDYYYEIEEEREYLDVEWYKIYRVECPSCHKKWLTTIDIKTADFYKNTTEYCLACGYPQGVLEYEQLESASEIEGAITLGFTPSEESRKDLEKIYPRSLSIVLALLEFLEVDNELDTINIIEQTKDKIEGVMGAREIYEFNWSDYEPWFSETLFKHVAKKLKVNPSDISNFEWEGNSYSKQIEFTIKKL